MLEAATISAAEALQWRLRQTLSLRQAGLLRDRGRADHSGRDRGAERRLGRLQQQRLHLRQARRHPWLLERHRLRQALSEAGRHTEHVGTRRQAGAEGGGEHGLLLWREHRVRIVLPVRAHERQPRQVRRPTALDRWRWSAEERQSKAARARHVA
eukprot:1908575-Prymnesium_polylepis.1